MVCFCDWEIFNLCGRRKADYTEAVCNSTAEFSTPSRHVWTIEESMWMDDRKINTMKNHFSIRRPAKWSCQIKTEQQRDRGTQISLPFSSMTFCLRNCTGPDASSPHPSPSLQWNAAAPEGNAEDERARVLSNTSHNIMFWMSAQKGMNCACLRWREVDWKREVKILLTVNWLFTSFCCCVCSVY